MNNTSCQWVGALVVSMIGLMPAAEVAAQSRPAPAPEFDIRAHYTKYEARIPMRDGKRLFTSIYVPKDTSKTYPFLMTRTPYTVGPYGADNYRQRLGPSESFDRAGYVFVFQDVRGRYMSEGAFVEMRPHIDAPRGNQDVDESTDTYDTVEWLLKNVANNNGKVGIWGISYPGFFTAASIIDSHPAIKAASPEAPMTDLFFTDDGYHGGAFQLGANFGFYTSFRPRDPVPCSMPPCKSAGGEPTLPPKSSIPFDYGTTDGYRFFLDHAVPLSKLDALFTEPNWLFQDQVHHATYDAYWQARDLSRHMHGIKCAVLTVGGWFDAEDLNGPFKTYHAIEQQNPGISNAIVVGPWVHGGWARWQGASLGRVQFASNTGEFWREHIILPFFEQHLKGNGDARLPEAYMFETGTNQWREFTEWPPKKVQAKPLYFHAGGKLSFDPPAEAQPSFDEYVSDPEHPVPFIPYTNVGRTEQEYMVADQRVFARRPDVLVYQTDPLDQDVTVAGPISAKLRVSTSSTDSDFVVKLIDVFPNDYPEPEATPATRPTDVPLPTERMAGYQMLVRGEPMRAKFRNNWEKPEAMTPGKVEAVNVDMPDVLHTFRRGHRIMVQVQSSWFPLTDLNPQTFVDIPNAKASDFKKATERVYHDKADASRVMLGVLGK
ncbi:MAG: CocE/NonD family hydrolase [Acidobacteriota bacterium]